MYVLIIPHLSYFLILLTLIRRIMHIRDEINGSSSTNYFETNLLKKEADEELLLIILNICL